MPPEDAPAITALDGEVLGKLCEIVANAFDADELEYILKVKMNLKLYQLVAEKQTLDILVFKLLGKLEQRGNVVIFLRALLGARPGRQDLRDLVETHCKEALEAATDAKVAASAAATGVDSLKDQLKNPEIRKIVTPHRDELVKLMTDIDVLANYKRLHDYLQTIQFTHHPQIADEVRRLRTDPLAAATLEDHVFQLDDICRSARKAAEALPDTAAVREEQLRWVDKLRSLIDDLRQAVADLDDQRGARAARQLRLVVRPQPSRLNTLLSLIAKKLPLDRLVQMIEDVIKAVSADGSSQVDLKDGLRSLQNLLPQLQGRVVEHEQWQEIENEFLDTDDFIEQGSPGSVETFNDLWPDAKKRIAALAQTDPEAAWAKRSQRLGQLIDQALAADVEAARTNFRLFRHAVLFHFFQVDRALRYQCEAILAIRTPLKSLLSEV